MDIFELVTALNTSRPAAGVNQDKYHIVVRTNTWISLHDNQAANAIADIDLDEEKRIKRIRMQPRATILSLRRIVSVVGEEIPVK